MKKTTGVAAIIALAVGLTWAAERIGGWLGFAQQEGAGAAEEFSQSSESPAPGEESVSAPTDGSGARTEAGASPQAELSEEVASIEDDLARIEEALQSEEVLEEFTPTEPLSADSAVPWPTDI